MFIGTKTVGQNRESLFVSFTFSADVVKTDMDQNIDSVKFQFTEETLREKNKKIVVDTASTGESFANIFDKITNDT